MKQKFNKKIIAVITAVIVAAGGATVFFLTRDKTPPMTPEEQIAKGEIYDVDSLISAKDKVSGLNTSLKGQNVCIHGLVKTISDDGSRMIIISETSDNEVSCECSIMNIQNALRGLSTQSSITVKGRVEENENSLYININEIQY